MISNQRYYDRELNKTGLYLASILSYIKYITRSAIMQMALITVKK